MACVTDASCRVLAVELVDESTSDVDAVGSVNHRNLTAIDNHGDATSFGESFECLADVLLQRKEDVLASFGVSSFSILAFSFELDIQLVELVSLLSNRVRVSDGLRVVDLFGQGVDSVLQTLQLGLPRLKLAIRVW